ncbi:MAG: hypothetical protein KBT03_04835 [Bacteroidales bacterium]|nr:hypothetical protein [Candidatus Scybalousia scybalohippi]
MTIDELKEHCKRTISPENKLAFDVNSRTYQEHKLTLDIIEELETLRYFKDKWNEYQYQQGRVDKQNEIIKALAEYNLRNMGNAEIFGFDIARSIVEQTK